MEVSERKLEAGDLCFAHVRTFPWWPARIVKTSTRKSKLITQVFSVIFFGTNETADLPETELSPVSPVSIQKYVTKSALRRKHYQEAYKMMLQEQTSAYQEFSSSKFPSYKSDTTDFTPAADKKDSFPSNPPKQEFLSFLNLIENQLVSTVPCSMSI